MGGPKLRNGFSGVQIADRGWSWKQQGGELSRTASLTMEQAREIRKLHAEGWNYSKLMEKFLVGKTCIGRIIRKESYKESAYAKQIRGPVLDIDREALPGEAPELLVREDSTADYEGHS